VASFRSRALGTIAREAVTIEADAPDQLHLPAAERELMAVWRPRRGGSRAVGAGLLVTTSASGSLAKRLLRRQASDRRAYRRLGLQ
jgi:hypothetical protein